MHCKDLLEVLSDFVDGELEESLCADIEEHLKGCDPCRVVVDSTKKTITLFKENLPYEIPLEVKDRLQRVLRERWKKGRDPA
ncbi:MAG: zf-HC2 domain-containing protein [candidate division NC10 bacterium]|nr:zf-HC2 domain-containing protein [candidate division NC10 bacterium]